MALGNHCGSLFSHGLTFLVHHSGKQQCPSPSLRMPAFDFSSWYTLFFIAFVIINTYIFMSLFLAVVYNNYKKHLKVMPRGACYQWIFAVLCKEPLAFPWKALRRGNSFLPLVLCK